MCERANLEDLMQRCIQNAASEYELIIGDLVVSWIQRCGIRGRANSRRLNKDM